MLAGFGDVAYSDKSLIHSFSQLNKVIWAGGMFWLDTTGTVPDTDTFLEHTVRRSIARNVLHSNRWTGKASRQHNRTPSVVVAGNWVAEKHSYVAEGYGRITVLRSTFVI